MTIRSSSGLPRDLRSVRRRSFPTIYFHGMRQPESVSQPKHAAAVCSHPPGWPRCVDDGADRKGMRRERRTSPKLPHSHGPSAEITRSGSHGAARQWTVGRPEERETHRRRHEISAFGHQILIRHANFSPGGPYVPEPSAGRAKASLAGQQSISSCVRRTRISRFPTWLAGPTIPSFSICSISLAALL